MMRGEHYPWSRWVLWSTVAVVVLLAASVMFGGPSVQPIGSGPSERPSLVSLGPTCFQISGARTNVTNVNALLGGAKSASTPTRILLVGDSQTRHLFTQLAVFLRQESEVWSNMSPSSLPQVPLPTTRFAFSWVTKTWPPWWFGGMKPQIPIVLKFVATEYAANTTWVFHEMVAFRPTHVVVGRGCWDMIRRAPRPQRMKQMCQEYQSLMHAAASLPTVRGILLFPHLRVSYIKTDGRSPTAQRTASPWTGCVVDTFQHLFRDALVACGSAFARQVPQVPVTLLEADVLSQDAAQQPNDGLHYDSPPVVRRLVAQILSNVVHGVASTFGDVWCPLGEVLAQLDRTFDERLRQTRCGDAYASYGRTLGDLVGRAAHGLSMTLQQRPPLSIPKQYLSCASFRFSLWRYLGPWPWHTLPSSMNALQEQCDLVATRCVQSGNALRNETIQLLLATRARGNGDVCKASALSLSGDFGWITVPLESLADVYCLNEPFGGRP